MYKNLVLLTFVVVFLTGATGYPPLGDLIPNGKLVPHPCKPNHIWKAVRNEMPTGSSVSNPFGRDWEANGEKWDECLCRTDSDGDGRTNGEELGDPDCVWTSGDVPHFNLELSHPGICEPMDSYDCMERNDWHIDCNYPEFTCDELDETEDVRNVTLQLSPTPVPSQEAVYMCQGMDIPADRTYHMIASEPLIDNAYVLHAVVVFKCRGETDAREKYSEPVACDRAPYPCEKILTVWTVGVSGSCLSSDYGVHMGQGSAEYVVIQIQWKNPEQRDDYVDSSGIVLYYTPNLRTYNMATFSLVEAYLQLPPGYSQYEQEGRCPGECTEHMFEENIYITEIVPHMHYIGQRMVVKHWRDGEMTAILMDDMHFNYGDRNVYRFEPAVEVQPGDELIIACTFDTKGQDSYVFFGEATTDEMCAAVVMSYPEQNYAGHCSAIGDSAFCGDISVATGSAVECLEKTWEVFSFHLEPALSSLYSKCDPSGLSCWDGCKDVITELRTKHACFHDDADEVLKNTMSYIPEFDNNFVLMWISCDELPDVDPIIAHSQGGPSICGVYPSSATAVKLSALAFVVPLAFQLLY